MCGIAGVISENQEIEKILRQVNSMQFHRGPDAQGYLQTRVGLWQVGLAHQRLAILDLSEAANQPMVYGDNEEYLIYNGEVYNYREIRSELENLGYRFKSRSDTEVILVALHHWGIDEAVKRFNGMWAFAWLDANNKRLILARDRTGVKPLYYSFVNGCLYFASEIKTILKMSGTRFFLNYEIIGQYLLQSLLETSPETFFQGIEKMPPGNYGVIDLTGENLSFKYKTYWRLEANPGEPVLSENELIEQVRTLFFDAVNLRLRSDVPLGVLLSGGIDSSSIAMAVHSILKKDNEMKLLSAVSNDPRYDESPYIDLMAEHLNCKVCKVPVECNPEEVFNYLQELCWINDEPVGSISNIAHYLLMKKAKENGITVILSGQGADELLCGYKKYLGFYIQSMTRKGHCKEAAQIIWQFWRQGTVLNQFTIAEAKRYIPGYTRMWDISIEGAKLVNYRSQNTGLIPGMSIQERQISDLERFSLPVINHYEDRMSMAWSREVRFPFQDYRLVELFVGLPAGFKMRNGWTKYIFRKAMEPFLPAEINWRKDKQGFVNPQSEWLKNELRSEVLKYFEPDSLIFRHGLVNRINLLNKYDIYCRQLPERGRVGFKDIFNPLALEIWMRKYEEYIA